MERGIRDIYSRRRPKQSRVYGLNIGKFERHLLIADVTRKTDPVIVTGPHLGGPDAEESVHREKFVAILQEYAAGAKTGDVI